MTLYSPDLSLRDARERYFAINNFPNGGYEESWVMMKVGPVPIGFPNTVARVKAVKFHDLHHVLTEYETTWRGETEIGAWEVATGLAEHYQGWLLDLLAFAMGLVINPRRVYRAFMRGRQSRNLFDVTLSDELLARRVGDVRRELRLDRELAPPALRDKAAFIGWMLASIATYIGVSAIMLAPLAMLILLIILLANSSCLTFWNF